MPLSTRKFSFCCFILLVWFSLNLNAAAWSSSPECLISAPALSAGQHPISVAVGDFDGDGNLDFAAANPPQGGISIRLGHGDGTFSPVRHQDVGFQPWYIVSGDFNADGKLDLAVADFIYCAQAVVWILLGNGDGTFQNPVSYPVDKSPIQILVYDFNSDGALDLAVVNQICSEKISILLGRGDGTFRSPVNYYAPAMIGATIGDFNGDGKMDLAEVGGDGSVGLLYGNGDGTFQLPVTSYPLPGNVLPNAVSAADLNHDGHWDLVIANIYGGLFNMGSVDVLLGNGDGTFQSPVSYDSAENSEAIALSDLNGDGALDIAVTTDNTNGVNVFLGKGDGSFSEARQFTTGDGSIGIAVGDFTRDGIPDLLVANNGIGVSLNGNLSPGNVSLLRGNGDGTFRSGQNTPAGFQPSSAAAADFNGDHKPDLAVTDYYGELNILLGNGDGSFASGRSYAVGGSLSGVVAGDFNRDGKTDLATIGLQSNRATILLGNGDGTFQKSRVYATGQSPHAIAEADFNLDGKLDLVIADGLPGKPGTVDVRLGNGDGSFGTSSSFPVGMTPRAVAVGDFNRDGKPDLAVANYISRNVSILLGNGDGTFQPAVNYVVGKRPTSVAVGDLNGDGILDLAVANSGLHKVSVLLGKGDGTFQNAVQYEVGHGPSSIAILDVNGDGRQDLVVTLSYTASRGNGTLAVLFGNGDGTFQAPSFSGVALLPRFVTTADFNGDGLPDLATVNYISNSVTVLLNSQTSGKQKRH